MVNEQTAMKMEELRLFGMAQCFRDLVGKTDASELTHQEFAGMLIDAESNVRENKRLKRLLGNARLRQQACIEDIDYKHNRGIHKRTITELLSCSWINNKQNILVSGATGVGKTYLACAIGNYACRRGFSVFYVRAPRLFTTLFQSRGDGSYLKQLSKLSRYNVLIIDDIGLSIMNETERKDFLEIIEDRHLNGSTIIGSQLPIKEWYQVIGEPTIADAVCDRLLHNAYKLELNGESMRKSKA